MPINFKDNTLQEYLDQLSRREPVPGGGSAAALTGPWRWLLSRWLPIIPLAANQTPKLSINA